MILQICGNIIDTQYIYKITEVKCDWYEVGDRNYERYCANGFFIIHFVNKKQICIDKRNTRSHKTMHTTEYKQDEAEISQQLNSVRDQLITKWKANQLAIPKIEFI